MRVQKVEFDPCDMPLDDPTWMFALATVSSSRGWIVRLTAEDGTVGYGYAPAIPHMGSTFEGLPIELARLGSLVEGQESFDIEAALGQFSASLSGASQAKGAIECALYDLNARLLGIPLYQMLGGKLRDRVPILRIVAIKSPGEMAETSAGLVKDGYQYLKIKVHGDVDDDVARVAAIRKRVGPDIHLTIDANQSYSTRDAIVAINRMAEYGIELAEQPVRAGDLKALETVAQAVPVVVEADEGAGTIDEIMTIVSNRICDAVSLKLPKLGGLRNAIAAARICEAGGVRYRLGAHVGTRLLAAHAMQLAVSLPGVDYACELGEFERMQGDPFEGINVVDGHLTLPEGPGCGVAPCENTKEKVRGAA